MYWYGTNILMGLLQPLTYQDPPGRSDGSSTLRIVDHPSIVSDCLLKDWVELRLAPLYFLIPY